MALQDAMHGYNLNVIEEEKIHIRIAANLGEVRVAKNDIFGEPVNVASRIEGITPADAIYLSEGVYMAMNKAEVPVEEVGFKDLDGVSQSVRLYCIPRFSVNRLIPEKSEDIEVGNELVYPYGGMHCHANNESRFTLDFTQRHKKVKLALSMFLLFLSILFLSWYLGVVSFNSLDSEYGIPVATPKDNVSTKTKPQTQITNTLLNNKAKLLSTNGDSPEKKTESITNKINQTAPRSSNQEKAVVAIPTKKAIAVKPTTLTETKKPTPIKKVMKKPAVIIWNVRKAKLAYRDKTLNKADYNEVIRELKITYKKKITKIKADYNSHKITKEEYKMAVTKAKNEYKGN